jgi:hypothetical protein
MVSGSEGRNYGRRKKHRLARRREIGGPDPRGDMAVSTVFRKALPERRQAQTERRRA